MSRSALVSATDRESSVVVVAEASLTPPLPALSLMVARRLLLLCEAACL